jgi:hypothetical protein
VVHADHIPQRLKPTQFAAFRGTAEQAAEKGIHSVKTQEKHAAGAEWPESFEPRDSPQVFPLEQLSL